MLPGVVGRSPRPAADQSTGGPIDRDLNQDGRSGTKRAPGPAAQYPQRAVTLAFVAATAMLLSPAVFPGVTLGPVIITLARKDLDRMQRGEMDVEALPATKRALTYARAAFWISAVFAAIWVGGLIWLTSAPPAPAPAGTP